MKTELQTIKVTIKCNFPGLKREKLYIAQAKYQLLDVFVTYRLSAIVSSSFKGVVQIFCPVRSFFRTTDSFTSADVLLFAHKRMSTVSKPAWFRLPSNSGCFQGSN